VSTVVVRSATASFRVTLQCVEIGHFLLVYFLFGKVVEAHSVAGITDFQGVHVRVGPADGALKNFVEFRHSHARGYQYATPDRGGNPVQFNALLLAQLSKRGRH
jgi:hypothetical protein